MTTPVTRGAQTLTPLVKRTCRLSDWDEKAVIQWVKDTPEMWDSKNSNFKNKEKRDKMWEDIGREMKLNPEHVPVAYRDLRDWNTKLLKPTKTGHPRRHTEREQVILERFAFLKDTVRHRVSPTSSVAGDSTKDLSEVETVQRR